MMTKLLGPGLPLLLLALLTSGCATRLADGSDAEERLITFQSRALNPYNGGQMVEEDALQPGDIILSATPGITSAGIRLLTLAPVSHAAIYVGEGQVAEAVGEGIRIRSIQESMAEESVMVAFRHPELEQAQAERMREFARSRLGERYNYVGVMLHAPFSVQRRVCELPLLPELVRDFCIRGIATVQLGAASNERFFCSQFVLEAYRDAGLPITDADPRFISPADILHMREGDVPAVRISQPLVYVGHLKYRNWLYGPPEASGEPLVTEGTL